MLPSVRDVDVIKSGTERDVLHAAAAVFVVFTGHLRLGGALHGDAQTPDTSPPDGTNTLRIS